MSNFQYLTWLSGIAKQASDISARQQKYSKISGKKSKLTSKDISVLGKLKKEVETKTPLSFDSKIKTTDELKTQVLKLNKAYKSISERGFLEEKLNVLKDLTTGVYAANVAQRTHRYNRGTWRRRGRINYMYNYGTSFENSTASNLEKLFFAGGVTDKKTDTIKNPYGFDNKYWNVDTWYSYIDKKDALKYINNKSLREKFGINYNDTQLKYLNDVLTNKNLEDKLYFGKNKNWLKVGMLHETISELLNPNASSEIKSSGVWLGKGGSQTSFLGGVYQVNPFSLYATNYKGSFFDTNQINSSTSLIAKREQLLVDSFLKSGNTLAGIDLSNYNKWIAEADKQRKFIDSSINQYLITGSANADSSPTSGKSKNTLNNAYGNWSGYFGKFQGINSPNSLYVGYINRAKNHAVLLQKAQNQAYESLQKAIRDQETASVTLTKSKQTTLSNLTGLLEQNKFEKTKGGKTFEQLKTEELKRRLSTSQGSSYKTKPRVTTQRPL